MNLLASDRQEATATSGLTLQLCQFCESALVKLDDKFDEPWVAQLGPGDTCSLTHSIEKKSRV